MDLMIDLETLATTPDAAILTIGACKFDPNGDDRDKAKRNMPSFYKRIDLQSNIDLGRRVDENTLRWWCEPLGARRVDTERRERRRKGDSAF